ncbi:hypothetical protein IB232_23255 [Pseudomonas sp. PDM15]|uniref:hypothetical protein n=1 Tax=Pseudomonas sp. PDM15 TaxID=2769303 RepID=UPI00177F17A3|nr:hypothetical protein [Pseudomonas sp. PDM15]MBD9428258.1 hypothetical protein [Pseudomonas sp. PDM15]
MGRRKPKSFTHWAIGVIGTVITALIIYQLRIHKAEYRLEREISRSQQQLQHNLSTRPPAAHQLTPEEVAANQEASRRQAEINHRLAAEQAKAIAEQQRKEGAWSKYFTPTQRCQIPESQRMADVCKANEAKLRARFEAEWAASERS